MDCARPFFILILNNVWFNGFNTATLSRLRMSNLKCTHHWEIAVADGPLSQGVCKICHATREFQNSLVVNKKQISLNKSDSSGISVYGESSWQRG
jgi:hypothetical protein